MPFYKFSWGDNKGKEYINNTDATIINTESIKTFIKPDIEDDKGDNKDVDEELLILAIKHFIDTS